MTTDIKKISKFLHKLMPAIGFILVCISFVFIYFKIREHFDVLSQKKLITDASLTLLLIASVVYSFISHLLAFAWCKLLQCEERLFSKQLLISVFGKSQIAKYLPGNVFHFVGRQVLSRDYGFSHTALLRSTIWEIGLHALAAILTGLLLLIACAYGSVSFFLLIIYLTLILIGLPALNKIIENNRLQALGLYCMFHLLSSLIFAVILNMQSVSALTPQIFLIAMGAYIIAWLVGFITPGAPGGLGIREIVLFMLLSPWVDHSTILITLAFSRIITILGDIIFFMIGMHLGRDFPKQVIT